MITIHVELSTKLQSQSSDESSSHLTQQSLSMINIIDCQFITSQIYVFIFGLSHHLLVHSIYIYQL